MPSVIKRRFQQRTPLVMGLWLAALMGGGGLGAAITPWLVQHSESWYQTLAWWALPAVVALFAWWAAKRPRIGRPSRQTTTTPVRVVFTPRAWTLGVYFGLINGGYASLIACLPAFYIEIGASAQYSGSLLALMTLGQAAGALPMPAMARHQDRRKLLMLALVLQLVGFCGFIWSPLQLPVLWAMGGWVRSGRRVSALFFRRWRSITLCNRLLLASWWRLCRESVLSSPGLPRGFLACCVVSAAIT